MQKFPWIQCFQIAMARGLAPDKVWHMTPGELMMVFHQWADNGSQLALNGRELATLLDQFPDHTEPKGGRHG